MSASVYHLTIDPHSSPDHPGSRSTFWRCWTASPNAQDAGLTAAIRHAKPGHRCIHNLNYWRFGDYLARGRAQQTQLCPSLVRRCVFRSPGYMTMPCLATGCSRKRLAARCHLSSCSMPCACKRFQLDAVFKRTGLRSARSIVNRPNTRADWRDLTRQNTFMGLILSDLQALFLAEPVPERDASSRSEMAEAVRSTHGGLTSSPVLRPVP